MPTPLDLVKEEIDDLADSVENVMAENAHLRSLLKRCYELCTDAPRGKLKDDIRKALGH